MMRLGPQRPGPQAPLPGALDARSGPGPRSRASIALLLAVLCGCGEVPEHSVVRPSRGELRAGFSEPAKTRLRRTLPIAMPVTARVGWIALEPGDRVEPGQVLAELDRVPLELAVAEAQAQLAELEARPGTEERRVAQAELAISRARLTELEAGVRPQELAMAEADLARTTAEQSRASVELARMRTDLQRQEALGRATSQSALDTARSQLDAAERTLEAARAATRRATEQLELTRAGARVEQIQAARAQVDQAAARLALLEAGLDREHPQRVARAQAALAQARHELARAAVVAPDFPCRVLARHQRGLTTLAAGTLLLELGRLDQADRLADLEAVVEVLTEDALRIDHTRPVELALAPGLPPIVGHIDRVEPGAFTKLSTLGVEEQRVRVLVRLTDPPPALGAGYRLDARFTTAHAAGVLQVPRFSVLERGGGRRVVFLIEHDRLVEREVQLGLEGDRMVEIRSGIGADQAIVAAPSTDFAAGSPARPRAEPR